DCVLDVGHADSETRSLIPIHLEIEVRLTNDAKHSEVFDASYAAHRADDLVSFCLERLKILAIDLDGQRTLNSAYRFFQVVGNGLRKTPEDTWDFLHFTIHGSDQQVLVLMEDRPPFLLWQEIDKELHIKKTSGVCAVIRTADLIHYLRHLRKG